MYKTSRFPKFPPLLDYGFSRDGDSRLPLIGVRNPFVIDEETMAILTGEHKLIARDYLTLGESVGKGHFGCVYRGRLQLPGEEDNRDVAVKTLQAGCKYLKLNLGNYIKSFFVNRAQQGGHG